MSKVVTTTTTSHGVAPGLQASQGKHPLARYYLANPSPQDVSKFEKRINDHYQYIVKILSIEEIYDTQTQTNGIYLYTEKLLPIKAQNWVPTMTALGVLKGFRRLSSIYGWMHVNENMIWLGPTNEVRVWISQDVLKNQSEKKNAAEAEMMKDILAIILKYDQETANIVKNCHSVNTAINCIFTKPQNSNLALEKKISTETDAPYGIAKSSYRYKTESFNQVGYHHPHHKSKVNQAMYPIIEHHQKTGYHHLKQKSKLPNTEHKMKSVEQSSLESSLNPKMDTSLQANCLNAFSHHDFNENQSTHSHFTFKHPVENKASELKTKPGSRNNESMMNDQHHKKKSQASSEYVSLQSKWKNNLADLLKKNKKPQKQRQSELSSQYVEEESIMKTPPPQMEYSKSNRFRTLQFTNFLDEKTPRESRISPTNFIKKQSNFNIKQFEEKMKRTSGERTIRKPTKSKKPMGGRSKEHNMQIKQTIKNRYGSPKKCTIPPEHITKLQTKTEQSRTRPRISEVEHIQPVNPSQFPAEKNEVEVSNIYEQRKQQKKTFAKQLKKQFNFLYEEKQKQHETKQQDLLNTTMVKSTMAQSKMMPKDNQIKQKVERKKATFADLKSQAMKILG